MDSAPIYSDNYTVALLGGKSRRVLTLNLPLLETSADGFPSNLKDAQRSLKPGEKIEWYIKDEPHATNTYRVKLGDMIAEELGFKEDDNWMFRDLPEGFNVFVMQKGTVDNLGKLVVSRQDSYLYGHQSGSRYRSPKEFLPHLIGLLRQNEGSLSGSPRNINFQYDPLFTCTCQHCAKKTKTSRAAMAQSGQATRAANIAINANYQRALFEAAQDVRDGAWRFRQGEIVWVFEAPPKPTGASELGEPTQISDPTDPSGIFGAGGRWFAATVVGTPPALSFNEFAKAYIESEPTRTHYRVQKCGNDHYVRDFNLRDILPWVKRPTPDDSRGIVIDHVSEAVAAGATKTAFVVARKPIVPTFDEAKTLYELEGIFLGPEKVWIGDALRISKRNAPANVSVWDPASHDLMIIRKIVVASTFDEALGPDQRATFIIYFSGDLLSIEHPRPLDPIPFQVPVYLQNAGTDYGKWIAPSGANGKSMEGTINTVYALGRFYDPRIMQIIDNHWQTVDDRVVIEGMKRDRAAALGCELLNGEVVRPPIPRPVTNEPTSPTEEEQSVQGAFSRVGFYQTEEERAKRMKFY